MSNFKYFDVNLENEVPFFMNEVLGSRGTAYAERIAVMKVLEGKNGPEFNFDYIGHTVEVKVIRADYNTNSFDIVISNCY